MDNESIRNRTRLFGAHPKVGKKGVIDEEFETSEARQESWEYSQLSLELKYLEIGSNLKLTDLSPLLDLAELKEVRVSDDMNKAISSLDGKDLSFEFIID